VDERDMEKKGQNEKRKGWGIERIFFTFFGIVTFYIKLYNMQESKSP
jgi:hypothetical protein